MTDEEITAMQAELETAKADLETTRMEVESLNAQLGERDAKMGALQGEIAEKGAFITSQVGELATLREASAVAEGRSATLSESLAEAVVGYKCMVRAANPVIPEEMITGDTIADIGASLESAKAVVAAVRAQLEAEAKGITVPPGAPARTPPDLASLSAREKIEYAIRKEAV